MNKTRTGKKVLSLLLTLCMVLSLMPVVGITASASGLDAETGVLTINTTSGISRGDGWYWNGGTKTLTLSGVDLTQLVISVPAAVVLEGANRITAASGSALDASDAACTSLTIEGSGTLEVSGSGSAAAIKTQNLTVNSGYITINNEVGSIGISAAEVTVSGGYLDITANSNAIYCSSGYSQTGGYVKATSEKEDNGVAALYTPFGPATVYGGFLEASGYGAGILTSGGTSGGNFTNSGGVVKATGTGTSGFGIFVGSKTADFSGGVTISEGTKCAVGFNRGGKITGGELYWTSNNGAVADKGTAVAGATITRTSVVIAKKIAYTSGEELDGHYIYSRSAEFPHAILAEDDITVTGGSYLYANTDNGSALYAYDKEHTAEQFNVTVGDDSLNHPTLVCVNKGDKVSALISKELTIEDNGTVVAQGVDNFGIESYAPIVSSGNLISVTSNYTAIQAYSTVTLNGGYLYAGGTKSGLGAVNQLNITGGYATACSTGVADANAGLKSSYFTVTGGAVTAIGGAKAYFGSEGEGTVTGAAAAYTPLGEAAYVGEPDKTYKDGDSAVTKVLTIKKTPPVPTFNDCFGNMIAVDDKESYVAGTTVHATKGYTFAGWYTGVDGQGTALGADDPGDPGVAYYAKWTVGAGGKIVHTSPISFSSLLSTDNLSSEGWSWTPSVSGFTAGTAVSDTNNSGIFTLSGLTIDTKQAAAMQPPNGAIIELADGSVNTITSTYNGNLGTYGIDCSYLLIRGTGSLNVTAGNSTDSNSSGIFTFALNIAGGIITTKAGAAGGSSGGSHGISAPSGLNITGGNVTAVAGTATADPNNSTAVHGTITTSGTVMAGADAASAVAQTTATTYTLTDTDKYVNVSLGPSAAATAVTIDGTEGTAITSKDVTITLTRDTFTAIDENTDVTDWFTGLPAGLVATIVTAVDANDATATITISGTPTAASGAALAITIPAAKLTSGEALTVTANDAAKFAIKPAAPAVGEGYTIDYAAETITVTSGYEVSTADSFTTTLASGATVIPSYPYYVRKAAAAPIPAGAATQFTVAERPTTPDALTADNVKSKTDTTIVLKGTSVKQQYACSKSSSVTDSSWIDGTGDDLTFNALDAGWSYSIITRVKATGTAPASSESAALSVTTKTAPATPPETITIIPHETYINFSVLNTCEYIITKSITAPEDWTNSYTRDPGGSFDFNTMIGNYAYSDLNPLLTSGTQYYLHYRTKGTANAMPSEIRTTMFYTLPKKPAAVAAGNITVTSNSITLNAAGNMTDKQYLVTPASVETLTGSEPWTNGTGSEYSFTDSYNGATPTGLTSATPYKVWVRVKANGGVPASEAASTTICTAIAPAFIRVTADTVTISAGGNTADKQYLVTLASVALTGSEEWTDGTGADLVVGSHLVAAARYKVWVRVKATSTVPASDAAASENPFYTAYPTPTADADAYSINAADNSISFDDTVYEVNTSADFSGTSKATGDALTSGTTYYIRHKAGTSPVIPASAPLAFTCAKAELNDLGVVTGTKGTAIKQVADVTITLIGDTFKDVTANSTTFSTNVADLTATVTAINEAKTVATVTISGTPTETKDAGLTITIPADKLQSGAADITSVVNSAAAVKIATDTVYPREDPADFNATEPATISYTDKYGNTQSGDLSTNITDSGEGWAWYAAESTDYDDTKAITAENHPYKTLILSGVNIETNSALALNLPDGATIVLKSGTTNTVKSTYNGNDGYTAGVTCAGELTIEGSGRLDATGGTATGEHDSMGVHGSNGLTINGGVVNGTGGASAKNSAGISADEGALTINGGTVKGQGGTSSYDETPENPGGSVGLYADGNIAVNGGSVTGNGGDAETAESIGISCGATVEIKGGSATGTGTTAAFVARSGIEFPTTFAINTPSNGVLVTRGDATTIFANATAEAPATNATIAVKPSSGGGGAAPATTVPVIVDGEEYNIGTAETSGGVTTVTVDQAELQKQLDSASENVVIPVTPGRNADTVTAQLVVANVDEMAEKEMTLSVQVDNVSYDMPAVAIDTKTLMAELGATDPAKVPVNVTIKELDEDDVDLTEGDLVMPPVSFTVTAGFGGKKVDVEVFERYVQRVIEVPDGGVASKITTAVVVENGKQHHVPTEVFQKDGKWYARINSLTNSVYALINNEKSFTDSDGKWYEAVVTEMASRGVIDGRDENTFDGEASITRAEFAAILVRALGLPENGDASMFTDVADDAWYYGAVGKAYEYKLIEGRGDGIFDPAANITRQEAMQMIYNASGIAPIELLSGINPGMYADLDTVSDWAKDAAGFSLLNGIVKGNDGLIRPLDNITRAESATIILRLLQKAELVDVRAEA